MGAKASTATANANGDGVGGPMGGHGHGPSTRSRTFSASSSAEVVGTGVAGSVSGVGHVPAGLSFLRVHTDRQRERARSLSSVPTLDMSSPTAMASTMSHDMALHGLAHGVPGMPHGHHAMAHHGVYDISESAESDSSSLSHEEHALDGLNLGRVYAAHSLPTNIWSLNGIKCPVCSKFVLSDDIECHIVMCLTKPRLSYNEDVLTDDKGECVICLEDLLQGNTIARLPCLCIYHKNCIDRWFEVNRSCPEHPGD
ncbi:E3 ubiquitin-protein ligase ZNRF1 [Thrips palmi]|uniref:E3 ubiquitin-protein ligase ZNRF1 n=1 Tax=Thrips palmi TaxID=161013 RepID=A0A6P8ZYG7_THRPL|nr:E3 ubiquitin-protein ligase ZNRF1 [Thrips palmi]